MNRTQIIEHIQVALSEVLNKEVTELSEDTRLFEDLALDSTSVIELLMALEDTVGLEIDPDELDPEVFKTVRSLADYVDAGRLDPTAS
ncbi:phosphopantetheine-binding protein [Streptomyces sp. NPDC002790]|uniref:acyl carrier protein n=1 Tax=unclassified Streptomyces TaxID=2593676 RepID=UPI00331D4DF8